MKILEPIRNTEILVLDDWDQQTFRWVLDIIGLVLNARYNERRVTILTTIILMNRRTQRPRRDYRTAIA